MTPPGWVENKLEPTLAAKPDGKVLVVEGDDDEQAYRAALDKLARGKGLPEGEVAVLAAGSKWAVLRGLDWLQKDVDWWTHRGADPKNLVAVVDRDEWDNATITAQRKSLPQLRVNGQRHCLESYFCDPEEIREALFANDDQKYKAPWEALRQDLQTHRADWVPHWALWVTLHRAASRLIHQLEFPWVLLDQKPLPNVGVIKQHLRTWAEVLDVPTLFGGFQQLSQGSLRAKHRTQFRSHVHGKDFFNQIVLPMLVKCDLGIRAEDWMVQLLEWWPELPPDLEKLLDGLLA